MTTAKRDLLNGDVAPLSVRADGGQLALKVSDDRRGIYIVANVGLIHVSRFIPTVTLRKVWAWLGEVLGHPVVPA